VTARLQGNGAGQIDCPPQKNEPRAGH